MTAWSGSNRKHELPADWPARRTATFTRDGWTCVTCGHHDPTGATLECDHLGDKHDHRLHMLRTLCGKRSPNNCHGQRTAQQAREAHAAMPRARRSPEAHPGLA